MQFSNFHEFIAMGGYGFYVWSSMFVTFFGLAVLGLEVSWTKRRLKREVHAQQARLERIQQAQNTH